VGVLGEESIAEAGEESVPGDSGRLPGVSAESWFGATDVTFDPPTELISRYSSLGPLGDLIVLAFEPLDFIESLDLSSLLLNHELLEPGLVSTSASSCIFVTRGGVAVLCWENSVSGGLGGRSSLGMLVDRGGVM
jgi:hypothetical protein